MNGDDNASKKRISSFSRILITVVGVAAFIVIAFISYDVIGNCIGNSQLKDLLTTAKTDVIVPQGCKEVNNEYSSNGTTRPQYNVAYQCDKALTSDEINGLLAREYPIEGYKYISGSTGNTATKNGIVIGYYGESFPINNAPTSRISVSISSIAQ